MDCLVLLVRHFFGRFFDSDIVSQANIDSEMGLLRRDFVVGWNQLHKVGLMSGSCLFGGIKLIHLPYGNTQSSSDRRHAQMLSELLCFAQ